MPDPICFLCDTQLNPQNYLRAPAKGQSYFECPRCGKYSIHDLVSLQVNLDRIKDSKIILSYWVRTHQIDREYPYLIPELVKKILEEITLPEINEQINNLISYIGQNSTYGKSINISLNKIISLIGSYDKQSLLFIFDDLKDRDLISIPIPKTEKGSSIRSDVKVITCKLTVTGWEKYKELTKPKVYNFKKHKLSADEKLWFEELLQQNFNKIDIKNTKVKLWGKVSKDFKPDNIDFRLVRDNRLTLVGLWHIDPINNLFSLSKKVIEHVFSLIKKSQDLKGIDSKSISESLNIPQRDIQITLTLLNDLGFFSGGSHQNDVIIFNDVHFYQDHTAYDKFLSYKSLEESMEVFFNQNPNYSSQPQKVKTKSKSYVNQAVWKQIAEEFEINQIVFGKKINFVKDQYTRRIIFRDVENAYTLYKNGSSKAAIILAGGVIEELLRIYLLEKKGHTFKENKFTEYVKICEANKYLRAGARSLTNSARDYRNLVHIENEAKNKTVPTQSMASGAVSAIFTIANDFN